MLIAEQPLENRYLHFFNAKWKVLEIFRDLGHLKFELLIELIEDQNPLKKDNDSSTNTQEPDDPSKGKTLPTPQQFSLLIDADDEFAEL